MLPPALPADLPPSLEIAPEVRRTVVGMVPAVGLGAVPESAPEGAVLLPGMVIAEEHKAIAPATIRVSPPLSPRDSMTNLTGIIPVTPPSFSPSRATSSDARGDSGSTSDTTSDTTRVAVDRSVEHSKTQAAPPLDAPLEPSPIQPPVPTKPTLATKPTVATKPTIATKPTVPTQPTVPTKPPETPVTTPVKTALGHPPTPFEPLVSDSSGLKLPPNRPQSETQIRDQARTLTNTPAQIQGETNVLRPHFRRPLTPLASSPVTAPPPISQAPDLSHPDLSPLAPGRIPVDLNDPPIPAPGSSPPLQSQPSPSPSFPFTDMASSLDAVGVLYLNADEQDFDQNRGIIQAEGNVELRFQGGVLTSDRARINLNTRTVLAEGNAAFVRGQQRLRGDRVEYNLTQETGRVLTASGEFYAPSSGSDFAVGLPGSGAPNTPGAAGTPGFARPESDRLTQQRPVTYQANPGQITITSGFTTNFGNRDDATTDQTNTTDKNRLANPAGSVRLPISVSTFRQDGRVNRWRFQAESLELVPGGWNGAQMRLTNDPFSPPQFEIRADQVRSRALGPLVDEIVASRPRYVFEDKVAIPTFRNRFVIDRRPRDGGLVTFGIDGRDRGGLYAERTFEPISEDNFRLNLTPQFYLQRAFLEEGGNIFAPRNWGLRGDLQAKLSPGKTLSAAATLTSFDPTEIGERTRAKVRLGQSLANHTLGLEYSYRDRIFNGSLGFRTVRQSIGLSLESPTIPLGNSGVTLTYQAALQNINAETDRLDLLDPIRENDRINLTRYQAGASLNRGFTLWQGKPLAATPEAALKYRPAPITPAISLGLGLTGLYSGYSNGESQESLTGSVSLNGQFGHWSRDWFDHTNVNVAYVQAIRGDASPFTFDRINDLRVVSFGLQQQVYGPWAVGFQTAFNLDTREQFSTEYRLEYSRRAYGIALRYNPVLELGSLSIRISDFDWLGGSSNFDAESPTSPERSP